MNSSGEKSSSSIPCSRFLRVIVIESILVLSRRRRLPKEKASVPSSTMESPHACVTRPRASSNARRTRASGDTDPHRPFDATPRATPCRRGDVPRLGPEKRSPTPTGRRGRACLEDRSDFRETGAVTMVKRAARVRRGSAPCATSMTRPSGWFSTRTFAQGIAWARGGWARRDPSSCVTTRR